MKPPAAFRASYSDWKLIRTRKVVQIVFEVPVEEADQAYQVLDGMPNSGESIWCAIARLKPDQPDAARPARKKQEWNELQPSAQISILCGETAFRKFLAETFPLAWNRLSLEHDVSPIERAIILVREHCGVASRADINISNPSALEAWNRLEWDYRAWQQAPAAGAA